MKRRKIVIFGDSAFAQIAYEYFTHDSEYEVAAFTVSRDFMTKRELSGLPVVPYEEVSEHYPPERYEMFIALVYMKLNGNRERFYRDAKGKGYRLATYVSSRAFVWHNVKMGDNCFIFENNVVQPFVTLGSNVILWSGNHIGHHATIGDHTFVASHAVISGFVNIGPYCFLGVNSTVVNDVSIGERCLIGAGALVARDIEPGTLLKGAASTPTAVSDVNNIGFLNAKRPGASQPPVRTDQVPREESR